MVNKLLAAVVVIVVIVAAAVFFNWPALRPTLPDVQNTGDSTCSLPTSSCNNTILTFYRCSNGSAIQNEYDCTKLSDSIHNWTCNPSQVAVKNGVQTTRANCDYASTAQQNGAINSGNTAANQASSNSNPPGNANAAVNGSGSGIQRAPPLAYCGNNYTDADETCNSCPGDFKCTSQEYCSNESGLCTKTNAFGDAKCTQQENATGIDCASCGCSGDNQICNEFSKQCQSSIVVNAAFEANVDAVVNATITASGSNTAYLGLVDTIYNNQSAKMAVFDCDTTNTFFCRTFVIIDRNGNVLETVHSS